MTPSPPWPAELTRHTGEQVRKFRAETGLSAEQLAEAVTAAGLPYTRSQVTNLEAKRRANITVGEVAVLAQVLGVPPLLLIFPLDGAEQIEVLPGRWAETWAAAKWFAGDSGLPGEDPMTWTLVRELREHDQALLELRKERLIHRDLAESEANLRRQMAAVVGFPPGVDLADVNLDEIKDPNVLRSMTSLHKLAADLERRERAVKKLEQDVIMQRRRLRRRGVVPPPMDAEFADLDAGEVDAKS